MRILWFSNVAFTDEDFGATGTWLKAMAQKLVDSGDVTLANITTGPVSVITRQDHDVITQWIVPAALSLTKHGTPPEKDIAAILRAVKEFSPDLIHVWGTESYWGLITAKLKDDVPSLLEIQGLKEPCSRVFSGGLTNSEQNACIGFKEIIKRRSIAKGKKEFEKWARFERGIILRHQYITTQSPWVKAWVKANNKKCKIFHNELIMREAFYYAAPWTQPKNPVIFCSAAYRAPYKGVHDAVKALALVKSTVPNVRLRIAGALQSPGFRQDGYIAWINKLAKSLDVSAQIDWLGALSAGQIIQELQNCSLMLMPSHCETYCVAMAEAMYLGVPTVTAYTGGSAWLARDEESALFFPPGDEALCAWHVERLLTDRELSNRLSRNARIVAHERNDSEKVVANQMEIYKQVITDSREIQV